MTTETWVEVRRTLSEVQAAAKAAGLSSMSGPAQLLHFGQELNTEELKLMEVPPDVMEALKSGQRSASEIIPRGFTVAVDFVSACLWACKCSGSSSIKWRWDGGSSNFQLNGLCKWIEESPPFGALDFISQSQQARWLMTLPQFLPCAHCCPSSITPVLLTQASWSHLPFFGCWVHAVRCPLIIDIALILREENVIWNDCNGDHFTGKWCS